MQSSQARQRKLEKKRVRREIKKQMARRTGPALIIGEIVGFPKMSDTLVDFAAPVLAGVDRKDPTAVRRRLQLAATVWNMVTARLRDVEIMAQVALSLADELEVSPDAALEIVRELVLFKLERYRDDGRLVTAVEVTPGERELHVTAGSLLA